MDRTTRDGIIRCVEDQLYELKYIKRYLYENPEIGGTEEKSSSILVSYLRDRDFEVTENFCDIPWAFRACYDSGRPGVSIGMTAEYDALPEIGHACGHNIIATAPMGACVALKDAVDKFGGKVILYGTPAEENLDRKLDMIEAGAFEEVDVCLNIHPFGHSMKSGFTTALDSWVIDFYGKSAHAGIRPEEGINALDAAVQFYQMVNFEKQYLKGVNLYGVIPEGGFKCSIIPDYSQVKFLARSESVDTNMKTRDMIVRAAEAVCRLTGARYTIATDEPSNLPMNTNRTLAEVFENFYEELSGETMAECEFGASTDAGNVSWVVPSIMPCIGVGCPDIMLHTPEFREACMTEAGDNAMKWAAEALALTGLRVMEDPELLKSIRREFVRSLSH